jgi:hypothetical protein
MGHKSGSWDYYTAQKVSILQQVFGRQPHLNRIRARVVFCLLCLVNSWSFSSSVLGRETGRWSTTARVKFPSKAIPPRNVFSLSSATRSAEAGKEERKSAWLHKGRLGQPADPSHAVMRGCPMSWRCSSLLDCSTLPRSLDTFANAQRFCDCSTLLRSLDTSSIAQRFCDLLPRPRPPDASAKAQGSPITQRFSHCPTILRWLSQGSPDIPSS